MKKEQEKLRRLTTDALLTALALALSVAERWIPIGLIVPIPGVKLGLANIVILIALICISPLDALAIGVVRSLILGFFGGLSTFLFSFAGGMLSLLVMWLLRPYYGRIFSLTGISLAGAAAHNAAQISLAAALLQEKALFFTYLPLLLLTGLFTGTLTAIAARPVCSFMEQRSPTARLNQKDGLDR